MQQQAETATRAEKALAAALEAKVAAEMEVTVARKAMNELKQELSVQRSVVGGGDSTTPHAESAVRPHQGSVPSEAAPVLSRVVSASSSLSTTRQRSNQRTRTSRRGRPAFSASEPDQTAESTAHSRGSSGVNHIAPKVSALQSVYDADVTAEYSAEVTEPLSRRSAVTKSRLKQAHNASATGVPSALIDPPRVVVRRLQRPGSAPAFHHTPISAAVHEAAPHSNRGHRNGGLNYRRTKSRQAALQMPVHFPSPSSGDDSVAVWAGSRQREKRGSARRRQRLSSPRSAVPRAVSGSKWRGRQQQPNLIVESQQRQLSTDNDKGMGISTRALHHLEVYTTAGRSRHTLEW